jgi:ADP-ribose pyrophosphatase YjhB (NUDIX family)
MEKQKLISNNTRRKILLELEESPKKFVELKKNLILKSNLLSYNLKILMETELVKKTKLFYSLSEKGSYLMPYVRKGCEYSKIPLPCVAVIVKKNKKILRRIKEGEPGKGKSIFIGGRINQGEDLFCSAERHVMEKTNMKIKNLKLVCINNYISFKKEAKTHYIVFFIKAETLDTPKNSFWVSQENIEKNSYPDNKFIVETMLSKRKVSIINSIYNEDSDLFEVVSVS